MIKRYTNRQVIAIFLVINMLSSIFPYNSLYANNNGPNAPEAGSFEPVDATDMVNLLTGDFTYVLPLLNVPSPEGGYPVSLAYHAGIAMDQEASWTGLGWNLNAGAINRNVNGAPDDIYSSMVTEYLWDSTQTIKEYSATVGWSGGIVSVGVGLSWGSHRSLGGHVSMTVGPSLGEGIGSLGISARVGTDGSSIGLEYNSASGLSVGVSLNSDGKVAGSLGFNANGSGFSLSTNGTFGMSIGSKGSDGRTTALNISLSSSGVGLSVTNSGKNKKGTARTKKGVGFSMSFQSTMNQGDYTTSQSGYNIPLFVPTPVGFLSFSFGRRKYSFNLRKLEANYVSGPLYFHEGFSSDVEYYKVKLFVGWRKLKKTVIAAGFEEAKAIGENWKKTKSSHIYEIEKLKNRLSQSYMDILELPVHGGDFATSSEDLAANPNFPNYDKFNVQSQGLSGAITARIYENGALFGLSDKSEEDKSDDNNKLSYVINGGSGYIPKKFRFKRKPQFHFENEISTYLETPVAILDQRELIRSRGSDIDILSSFKGLSYSKRYYDTHNIDPYDGDKIDDEIIIGFREFESSRVTSNHIAYYSNREILMEKERLKAEGFLEAAYSPGLDRNLSFDGIGAFKITAIDGKTYHYSLPVYNHEIIQRTHGISKDLKTGEARPEKKSYFEKRQMTPFATHWLLTAVTGSDFIDKNNNGVADEGDYGYWVSFNYGKYSDAVVWGNPYGKHEFTDPKNSDVKTWVRGRKDLYYLDAIRTRSHMALFVKSTREDSGSIQFSYSHAIGDNKYGHSFEIPGQHPLKLDKVVLLKRSDLDINAIRKRNPNKNASSIHIHYPNEVGKYLAAEGKKVEARYNVLDAVIDSGDDLGDLKSDIVKSVDLSYDYSLVQGTPMYTIYSSNPDKGRLTLKSVRFNGKEEYSVLPPYRFSYINDKRYNEKEKDPFGYVQGRNEVWSLKEIETPEGGKIKVDYEPHKVKSVLESHIAFSSTNSGDYSIKVLDSYNFKMKSPERLGFKIGEELIIRRPFFNRCTLVEIDSDSDNESKEHLEPHETVYPNCKEIELEGVDSIIGKVTRIKGNTIYAKTENDLLKEVKFRHYYKRYYVDYKVKHPISIGGVRVKRVSTVDEQGRSYSMDYGYGKDNNGVGYITYLPYATDLAIELPYSAELPPPKAMYEYVTTSTSVNKKGSEDSGKPYGTKTEYHFNVLKEKKEGEAKFGDFYEIKRNSFNKNNSDNVELLEYTIKDNLGAIGQLLGVKTYNEEGHLLSNLENTYYGLGETPNRLGVTQESYQTYKKVRYRHWVDNSGVSSTRITYPNLLKSSREVKGGVINTTDFKDLDPITGQSREVHSYSSTGLEIVSVGIQAYKKYPQMGSKYLDVNNKNMLSQKAGSYVYLLEDNKKKVLSSNMTTWKNEWFYRDYKGSISSPTELSSKIWLKHKEYIWDGELTEEGDYLGYNLSTHDNFEWGVESQKNSKWRSVSEVTLYNHYSSPLEVKDINGNYASTKKGHNDSQVLATSNAMYTEMYYSGAESRNHPSYYDGELHVGSVKLDKVGPFGLVKLDKVGPSSLKSHTGYHCSTVDSKRESFVATMKRGSYRSGSYKLSVWVDKGNESKARVFVNGSIKPFNGEKSIAGDWVLLSHYEDLSGDKDYHIGIQSSEGLIYADDFRLHPVSSSMNSYVYNQWGELSYLMGSNGLSTHYKYDSSGRLTEVWTEVLDSPGIKGGFKLVKRHSYNYHRSQK